MYDENGFVRLTKKVRPVESTESVKPVKDQAKDKKSKKKNPFKKGSWKYRLSKLMTSWKQSPFCKKFHFTKVTNLLIQSTKSGKQFVTEFNEKLKNKIIKGSTNGYVLINVYDGIYTRISCKTYRELCLIDKISISSTLRGSFDGQEYYDITTNEVVINNINDLMRYIVQHRFEVEGVLEIESMCCGYTTHDHIVKMLVYMADGTYKIYKGDFNEFLKDYDIRPLI